MIINENLLKVNQRHNNGNEQHHNNDDYSTSKQQQRAQKKRSKGQKVDSQLLGFTVQPDPNLKNRGDIDDSL